MGLRSLFSRLKNIFIFGQWCSFLTLSSKRNLFLYSSSSELHTRNEFHAYDGILSEITNVGGTRQNQTHTFIFNFVIRKIQKASSFSYWLDRLDIRSEIKLSCLVFVNHFELREEVH